MPNVSNNELTILVAGIVKNVANTIQQDFSTIQKCLADFYEVKWFLVESDSEDDTIDVLKSLSQSNNSFRFVSLGKIQKAEHPRTIGMAIARNKYLQELRENSEYKNIDILAVADFNGLNSKLTRESINSCFEIETWDACFANQSGRYYDIWALRHPIWSPNDCWQQHEFFRKYYRFPEYALSLSIRSRMIHIPLDNDWIEVESAFGGFALYKVASLAHGKYEGISPDGQAICEHVPFHKTMRDNQKRLFINPKLINTHSTDHSARMGFLQTILRILKYLLHLKHK